MAYRIKNWKQYFESYELKKLKRMTWVAIPNKTDGEGYTTLVDHPNGAAHFGAWIAIVEIASKQDPRGNLPPGINGDISRSLARMSRLPARVFEEVLPRLVEIGWVEEIPATSAESAASPARSAVKTAGHAAITADDCFHADHAVPARSAAIPAESAGTPALHNKTLHNKKEEDTRRFSGTTQASPEKQGVCAPEIQQQKIPEIHQQKVTQKVSGVSETVGQRFLEWLAAWPSCADRDGACRAWVSRVTPADELAAFACRDRYLASDQARRGILQEPKKFILVQADSGWAGTWISDTTQLDPSIAGLKDIERRIKEMDEHDQRNGRTQRGIQAKGFERISETARRSGIDPGRNGNSN